MKKLTQSDILELKYAAEQASPDWIGKLAGGGAYIAYFEGGHKLVRNDDVDCYHTARYISTASPETILAIIDRMKKLEQSVTDLLAENSQLLGLYDVSITKDRPKRKEFADLELTNEDMW